MKNSIYKKMIIPIAFGSLMALPVFAAMNSELSISMQDNTKFTMTFDNTTYPTASNIYNVTNVFPGSHHVRMMSVPTITYNSYSVPRLLFDGWVNFPENCRLTAYANNFSQLNITSIVQIVQPQVVYWDPNVNYGNGFGNYYNNYYGNGYGNSSDYTNNNYGQNNYTPPILGMPAADFQALKSAVADKAFDSSKLTLAEQAIAANHLTSKQVLELVQLFDFDSSKLELAKFAYGHTADKNNYYLVSNAFDFESSITNLSEYINTYHV